MVSIYYTVGPASKHLTQEMFAAGAQGVRQTFSYGTPEIQLELAQYIRTELAQDGIKPFIIADLEGGGFRLGNFTGVGEGRPSIAVKKDEVIACRNSSEHNLLEGKVIPIPDIELFSKLQVRDVLIVGDGSAELHVIKIAPEVEVRNMFDGIIEGRRGLWRQSTFKTKEPVCLTQKDIIDLKHIAAHDEYNAVALSFVSSVEDIVQAREIMAENGVCKKIIAKIETKTGLKNIDAICRNADEIMVARGDLLLAVSWQCLAGAVERIVESARRNRIPYIMATQVAEGMMHGNHLTRAELCDLWHWKQNEVSGVLLSRETCWGERPVATVDRVRKVLDQSAQYE